MKKYSITVNGKAYEVEVEELGGSSNARPMARATKPAPVASKVEAPKAVPKAPKANKSSNGAAGAVNAPMPGTVLDVKVNVGDSVSNGDVLLILEAMKMENEIMASGDGKVTAINVTKGAAVNAGDVLIEVQ